MANDTMKHEIKLLLRDYMNFLPPGPQEAFVPVGTAMGAAESSWPLTPESLLRMEDTYVGETYKRLNDALKALREWSPDHFVAIQSIYLYEEAGHRDEDFLRSRVGQSDAAFKLILLHDEAIDWLANYLEDADLHIRWPQKAAGPKPGQDMSERHNELFAIFKRYYAEMPYRQALTNAVFHMIGPDGQPYYSRRHADRIIRGKLQDEEEEG